MIKKIKEIFQPYMIRPMLYQSVTKLSVALLLALLWNQFLNPHGYYSVVRDAFLVAGVFFFMFAWFQYLKLDGMRVHHLLEERGKKKRKKRHSTRDIVDFADEKIISFDELQADEQVVCRFLGDLLCGVLFLAPAGAAYLIG